MSSVVRFRTINRIFCVTTLVLAALAAVEWYRSRTMVDAIWSNSLDRSESIAVLYQIVSAEGSIFFNRCVTRPAELNRKLIRQDQGWRLKADANNVSVFVPHDSGFLGIHVDKTFE